MQETWVGKYAGTAFSVVVNTVTGRVVTEEGAPKWAKGLSIRNFKRAIWRGFGDVEREEDERDDLPEEARPAYGVGGDEGTISEDLPEMGESREKSSRSKRQIVPVTPGMNLKNALQAARKLGCTVRTVRRSGEVRVSHASCHRRVNLNRRKKSAPRSLTTFLIQLQG